MSRKEVPPFEPGKTFIGNFNRNPPKPDPDYVPPPFGPPPFMPWAWPQPSAPRTSGGR